MLTKTPLVEAIQKGNFAEAETLVHNGEGIPAELQSYNLMQLYENMISKKAFAVIDALLAKRQINTDVYELDKFDQSIYKPLITRLPIDDESIAYLKKFVQNSQNINDEVDGKTLLSYAFDVQADVAIIKALIDAGCNVDFKNVAEDNLICQVVRINMMPQPKQRAYVELLIEAGVDVNETNVVKQSALHIAVERDKNYLVDILLQHGAQPNEQDKTGNTAFYYALAHKHDGPLYKQLSAHTPADFTLVNRDGQTALSEYLRMMQGGDSDLVLLEQLLEDGADLTASTPYYGKPKSGWDWMIEKGLDFLKLALDKTGVDINMQDNDGNTFLHKICRIDSNYSQDAAKNTYRKVKFLLEAGADPSITNTKDETALMLASADNLKTKTVELLLSAKR